MSATANINGEELNIIDITEVQNKLLEPARILLDKIFNGSIRISDSKHPNNPTSSYEVITASQLLIELNNIFNNKELLSIKDNSLLCKSINNLQDITNSVLSRKVVLSSEYENNGNDVKTVYIGSFLGNIRGIIYKAIQQNIPGDYFDKNKLLLSDDFDGIFDINV